MTEKINKISQYFYAVFTFSKTRVLAKQWIRRSNQGSILAPSPSAPYYGMNPLLKCSDMLRDSKGFIQFYLSPTHEPYLPLLPSRRASPPFGWYSLHLSTTTNIRKSNSYIIYNGTAEESTFAFSFSNDMGSLV